MYPKVSDIKNNEDCEPVIEAAQKMCNEGSKDETLRVIVFLAKLRGKLIRDNYKLRDKVRKLMKDSK